MRKGITLIVVFIALTSILSTSCTSKEEKSQLQALSKQLNEARNIMLNEDMSLNSNISRRLINMKNRTYNPSHKQYMKSLCEVSKKIATMAFDLSCPKDSAYFYNLNTSILNERFKTIKALMVSAFKDINDSIIHEQFVSYIYKTDSFEISNNKDLKPINILSNQISILGLLNKIQKIIYQNVCEEGNFDYDRETIEFFNGNVGDKYTACLTYVASDKDPRKINPKLVKITLDGKPINVEYVFTEVSGVSRFIFIPRKKGLYEWIVNTYYNSPFGIKMIPFSGKVKV